MDYSSLVQGNAIELNVSYLPRGAYILHALNSQGNAYETRAFAVTLGPLWT